LAHISRANSISTAKSIQLEDFSNKVGMVEYGLGISRDVEVARDADFFVFGFEEFAETGVVDAVIKLQAMSLEVVIQDTSETMTLG